MALGTSPAGVVRLVLSRVALLVGGGVVAGAVVSLWAVSFVGPMLFDDRAARSGNVRGCGRDARRRCGGRRMDPGPARVAHRPGASAAGRLARHSERSR